MYKIVFTSFDSFKVLKEENCEDGEVDTSEIRGKILLKLIIFALFISFSKLKQVINRGTLEYLRFYAYQWLKNATLFHFVNPTDDKISSLCWREKIAHFTGEVNLLLNC